MNYCSVNRMEQIQSNSKLPQYFICPYSLSHPIKMEKVEAFSNPLQQRLPKGINVNVF